MRSYFSNASFARFDLGSHILRSPGLAQASAQAFAIPDWLSKLGYDPADIDKIADSKFRDEYKAEFERCKEKDSIEGAACMVALAAKVYAKLQEEEKRPYVPVKTVPKSDFPYIPVAIGGLVALGLIYFLATKGK